MDTVVQSPSRTVVIGPEQPFCVIGERINPTGREAFQAQLQAGDLSQIETDVAQQVEGGADLLDVNVGDPLADEVDLMGQAIRSFRALRASDLHRLFRDRGARGGPLGVRGQGARQLRDGRGRTARGDPAARREARSGRHRPGERRRDPDGARAARRGGEEDRLGRGRPRHPSGGRDHRPARDACRRGAPRGHALPRDAASAARRARREHDLRRVEHVVRPPRPPHPRRRVPRRRAEPRADERDHGRPPRRDRRGGARDRLPPRPRRVGRRLDPRYRAKKAATA